MLFKIVLISKNCNHLSGVCFHNPSPEISLMLQKEPYKNLFGEIRLYSLFFSERHGILQQINAIILPLGFQFFLQNPRTTVLYWFTRKSSNQDTPLN